MNTHKRMWTVVLHGCETWSLTRNGVHILRVFENRVLREIFCHRREEVVGGGRELHCDWLHDLYLPRNIIRIE
jgi:hypothetical protein